MNSDDYYSSDSYSESYSDIPNSSKKINVSPPKASQTIRRPLPNARRPIPVRSPIQNINKTPNKSNFQSNITNSSSTKKKIQIPIGSDSDSGSYYESEYSDKYQIPPNIISPPVQQIKQSIKTSPPQNQFASKELPQSNQDNDESGSNEENGNLYGLQNYQAKDENNGFQDTEEEPQIILSKETINSLKPKAINAAPSKPLPSPNQPKINENINLANSNEGFSMTYSDLSESLLSINQNVIYRVTRSKSQLSHYSFKLFCRDQCLMSANSSNIKKYVEFKADGAYGGDLVNASLKISKRRKKFILNNNGHKIMSVTVSTVKQPLYYERFFIVTMKVNSGSEQPEDDIIIKTMMPKKRPDGKYSMNFGGKFTKRSIKNAILINDREQKMLTVRRIADSQLEVEANPLINEELQIFAFGIISWICPY